ncbi:MAG: protein kinase domain-containing protein [Aggregatilineales bacterium]
MPDLTGQTIGPYRIVALLGKGGMAEVYRARQTLGGGVGRDVALKLIDVRLAMTPEFVARFRREAETLVALSHPHILKAFDFGEYAESVYLVMELMPGGSLAELVRRGALPFEAITRLLDQIGSALDYAHEQGVIHRDLKPHNVLFDSKGNAFLTDFGIVKLANETSVLTQRNAAIGTPAYMAPEQWSNKSIDARTDLYSLGVMLFEMIAGRVPFQGDTPFHLMHLHANELPPSVTTLRPDAPAALDRVIHKALAKDPTARYQSAAVLTADVRTALAGGQVNAPPIAANISPAALRAIPNPLPPMPMPTPPGMTVRPRQTRGIVGIVAGLVVLTVIGLGIGLALNGSHTPATPTALPTPTFLPTQPIIALLSTDTPISPTATAIHTPTPVPTNTPIPPTATASATATHTSTPVPTNTSIPPTAANTNTPGTTPTVAPALSPLDQAKTLRAVQQTQTATLWTHTPTPTLTPTITFTPTPNDTATLNANLTLLAVTDIAQAANQTATASLRTAKPTLTLTYTPTFTLTPTFMPTAPRVIATTAAAVAPTSPPIAAVTANKQWTPKMQTLNVVSMMLVPPGCFMMGSDPAKDPQASSDEQPQTKICFMQPFWIDQYPVTQAQFKQLNGKAANSSYFTGDQRPVESITWFEARDYCAQQRGARLPTEAEYEYAARGPDDLIYPWGNTFVPNNVVHTDSLTRQTAEVGSKPGGKSWVGALDMSGNVWEWTSSIYKPYPYDATDGREDNSDAISGRVLLGSLLDYDYYSDNVRAAIRLYGGPSIVDINIGFRCVRS